MGRQKRSKKRRHSSSRSESSSRRSYSRRSQSSQSYKHRQKKHKHKHDQRRKDESKKDKKHSKEQKRKEREQRQYRNRQRQQQRERGDQRIPKRENQNNNQFSRSDIKSQYLKHQQIEANKFQQERQQHSVSQLPQRTNYQLNAQTQIQQQQQKPKKQQVCFEPSGILLQYYNSREGVSLRFHQPPEGREPEEQWRMYVFKGEEVLKPIMLTKSSYLIGKDDRVVDILAENPSISRQHCVIQFRLIQKRQTEGEYLQVIKPYVMDLESTNGTMLNDQKIQSGRYYELLHRDVLKFGFSDRQYVIVKWEGDGQNQQAQEGN